MTTGGALSRDAYLAYVEDATERFARAVEHGPLDAPVESCPGWDLRQLTEHMGGVHRWAERAAATAARPEEPLDLPEPDVDATTLAGWLRDGAGRLVATLRSVDPGAATWHPFPIEKVAAVWPRRQAHETTIHCWDAEHAVGATPAPIDRTLAADGIDEYFTMVVPRLVVREGVTAPSSTLSLRCTDTGDVWLVTSDDGEIVVNRSVGAADGELVGSASGLLGRLWHRPIDDADVEIARNPDVVLAWLDLPGL